MAGKKQSSGKRAMFNEAKAVEAKGKKFDPSDERVKANLSSKHSKDKKKAVKENPFKHGKSEEPKTGKEKFNPGLPPAPKKKKKKHDKVNVPNAY